MRPARPSRAARWAVLAFGAVLAAGCGKKAPLRLPDQQPAEKAGALVAHVRENAVTLEFRVPSRRIFPEREEPWVLARVLRREGGEGKEFVEAGAILEPKGFPFDERLSWTDEGRAPGSALAYRVEFRSGGGRRRALSGTVVLGVGAVPLAPQALKAVGDEGAVSLAWEAPAGAGDGTRYRVYRREGGGGAAEGLGSGAESARSFLDTRVTRGREYCYTVRAVAGAPGSEVEGPASEERCARTEDATPPPAPADLRAAVVGGDFSLTWTPVAAADLLGYHVYRAAGEGNFQRITASPVEGSAYRDPAVEREPGTILRWSVTAVDRSPRRNESPLSAPATQVVPPRPSP